MTNDDAIDSKKRSVADSETKALQDVQKAHDVLLAVISKPELSKKIHRKMSGVSYRTFKSSLIENAIILCWLLGHESGEIFEGRLRAIESFAKELGYELEEHQENNWFRNPNNKRGQA